MKYDTCWGLAWVRSVWFLTSWRRLSLRLPASLWTQLVALIQLHSHFHSLTPQQSGVTAVHTVQCSRVAVHCTILELQRIVTFRYFDYTHITFLLFIKHVLFVSQFNHFLRFPPFERNKDPRVTLRLKKKAG